MLSAAVLVARTPASYAAEPSVTPTPGVTLRAIVEAGSSDGAFEALTFIDALGGAKATPEIISLTRRYGAPDVKTFVAVFDYAIAGAVSRAQGRSTPGDASSSDSDGSRSLTAALWRAGVRSATDSFDADRWLGSLVPAPAGAHIDADIGARFGRTANATYHRVFAQLMQDLARSYGIVQTRAR